MLDRVKLKSVDLSKVATPFDDVEADVVADIRNEDTMPDVPQSLSSQPEVRVHFAPGTRASRILSFIFSRKAFNEVFAQAIADMREEYADALSSNKVQQSRWIVFRDHLGLALVVAAYVGATVGKRILGIWKLIP